MTDRGLQQINNPGTLSWIPSVMWEFTECEDGFGGETHFNRVFCGFLFFSISGKGKNCMMIWGSVSKPAKDIFRLVENTNSHKQHHMLHLQPHILRKAMLYAEVNRERNFPEILCSFPHILQEQEIRLVFCMVCGELLLLRCLCWLRAPNHRGNCSAQGRGWFACWNLTTPSFAMTWSFK